MQSLWFGSGAKAEILITLQANGVGRLLLLHWVRFFKEKNCIF